MDQSLTSLLPRLASSVVYTPDSDGYQDSLRRWSNTGIKHAVRSPLAHNTSTHVYRERW